MWFMLYNYYFDFDLNITSMDHDCISSSQNIWTCKTAPGLQPQNHFFNNKNDLILNILDGTDGPIIHEYSKIIVSDPRLF